MAIPKQVKVGGTYYKGSNLTVDAAAAAYALDFTFAEAAAMNGVIIIPNKTGDGDTIKVEHIDTDGVTVKKTLAEGVPNVGAWAAWKLDFPGIQKVLTDETIRITYTNAAGVAMTVYAVLERIGRVS